MVHDEMLASVSSSDEIPALRVFLPILISSGIDY